jgi:hypothetical protein
MQAAKITAAVAVAAATMLGRPQPAAAQLGLYTLPRNDFIWYWGDTREGARRAFEDLSASGSEGGFRCELTAKLGPATRMSPVEIRALENDLAARLDFIYAVSQAMNYLDQTRELDWAVLDCKKREAGPVSEEERAERESRAREKMQRELDRRRERQRDDSE